MRNKPQAFLAVMLLVVCSGAGLMAAAKPGLFSKTQSDHGASVYKEKCAACHGADLAGGDHAPPLKDDAFWPEWEGQSARSLYSRIISTMPPDDAGSLAEKDVLDIVAYLVRENGVAASDQTIGHAADLNSLKLERPD